MASAAADSRRDRPVRFFFGLQPYELDDSGGDIGRVDFDRHGGSLPVRPFHQPKGSSRQPDNTSADLGARARHTALSRHALPPAVAAPATPTPPLASPT